MPDGKGYVGMLKSAIDDRKKKREEEDEPKLDRFLATEQEQEQESPAPAAPAPAPPSPRQAGMEETFQAGRFSQLMDEANEASIESDLYTDQAGRDAFQQDLDGVLKKYGMTIDDLDRLATKQRQWVSRNQKRISRKAARQERLD